MSFLSMITSLADNLQMTLTYHADTKRVSGQKVVKFPAAKGLPKFDLPVEVVSSFTKAKDGQMGVLTKIGGSFLLLLMYNQRHGVCSAYVVDRRLNNEVTIRGIVSKGKSIREVYDTLATSIVGTYIKTGAGNWKPFKG